MRDIYTNRSKGYAFIEYSEPRNAEIAYKRADAKRIDNKVILVDMEKARLDETWLPRRLGGGKGGEKRKATKEHQEYIKSIRRELRMKEKEAK